MRERATAVRSSSTTWAVSYTHLDVYKRQPLNNIALEGGRPVWKGTCTHCMACIGGCPAEAIEYGEKSKGRRRYYLKEGARA